MGAILDSWNLR